MILTKKKKRAIIFFLYIYLIMGGTLVYLIFFNSGLGIIEKITFEDPGKELFFHNNSGRIIHDITISVLQETGQKTPIMHFDTVLPAQEKKISLEQLANFQQAVLIAEAPYHAAFTKLFVLAGGKKGINYGLRFPSAIFEGTTFGFELQACNELGITRQINVSDLFDAQFLQGEQKTDKLLLQPKQCGTIQYTLFPAKTGQTTIFFNIEVENNKDRISKTIDIVK